MAIRGAGEVRVLTRGDPRARPERIRVPLGPVDVAAGYGAVWVTGTTAKGGRLTRIEPD